MGVNDAVVQADTSKHKVHGGNQNPPADQWVPFEWNEPRLGKQVHGEIAIARAFGTSGSLSAGFWRTGPTSPGASADGSHRVIYSAPLGDETAVVLDGSATLTVTSTGKKYEVGPGSIISSPKNLEVQWDLRGPSFKKYWCIFDGTQATPNPPTDLLIGNVSDNPPDWQDYHFTEPKEGPQVAGELFFIRPGGSTGTMMSGLWRAGKGISSTNLKPCGEMMTPYTGVLGDETMFLLEGQVEIIETVSGKRHSFRAGDVVGLSSGMHITWVSKGPFVKKLWVITRDVLPS
jgi:uncharacterized cupin superfamily protein